MKGLRHLQNIIRRTKRLGAQQKGGGGLPAALPGGYLVVLGEQKLGWLLIAGCVVLMSHNPPHFMNRRSQEPPVEFMSLIEISTVIEGPELRMRSIGCTRLRSQLQHSWDNLKDRSD